MTSNLSRSLGPEKEAKDIEDQDPETDQDTTGDQPDANSYAHRRYIGRDCASRV